MRLPTRPTRRVLFGGKNRKCSIRRSEIVNTEILSAENLIFGKPAEIKPVFLAQIADWNGEKPAYPYFRRKKADNQSKNSADWRRKTQIIQFSPTNEKEARNDS